MATPNPVPKALIQSQTQLALSEDIGQGDLTADLIPAGQQSHAQLISRQDCCLCGQDWFNSVFQQLDANINIEWYFNDGDSVTANSVICKLYGPARALLTGERTAINFLQTLSATATISRRYAEAVAGLPVSVLDTRKTLPGLRLAQKYAVQCGGCDNHRFGLYDAILIKENHINAADSIDAAVKLARQLHPDVRIEVEVENLDELRQALAAQADIIMLDNFPLPQMIEAVAMTQKTALLEASGNINLENIRQIAATGVDRISIGALTKDIAAIDLSMRFDPQL